MFDILKIRTNFEKSKPDGKSQESMFETFIKHVTCINYLKITPQPPTCKNVP